MGRIQGSGDGSEGSRRREGKWLALRMRVAACRRRGSGRTARHRGASRRGCGCTRHTSRSVARRVGVHAATASVKMARLTIALALVACSHAFQGPLAPRAPAHKAPAVAQPRGARNWLTKLRAAIADPAPVTAETKNDRLAEYVAAKGGTRVIRRVRRAASAKLRRRPAPQTLRACRETETAAKTTRKRARATHAPPHRSSSPTTAWPRRSPS